MSISEQFFGKTSQSDWVTRPFRKNNLLKLVDRSPHRYFLKQAHFWVIGPKKNEQGLFLYAHSKSGSIESPIHYLNPKDNTTLIVGTSTGDYELKYAESASNWAKKLNMLINGSYTDVALISSDVIFNLLFDETKL